MEFIKSNPDFPFTFAVIHNVKVLETVLTVIPPDGSEPFAGDLQKGMLVEAGFLCEVLA
jgi:hypothetical protein